VAILINPIIRQPTYVIPGCQKGYKACYMTFSRMNNYCDSVKNIFILFLIVVFIFESTLGYSLPVYTNQQIVPANSEIVSVKNTPNDFYIPASYGTLQLCSAVNEVPKVILISDAHCNYEAQHNIANILKVLIRQYGISFIAVEGAENVVDVSSFSGISDELQKDRVIDQFVREGYITGPEFLKIVKDKKLPFTLYGVEDTKEYKENYELLKDSLKDLGQAEKTVEDLIRIIGELKDSIYSGALKEFDVKTIAYRENKNSLTEYAKYLLRSIKFVPQKAKYRNFYLLDLCIKLENNIDLKEVEEEREVLIKQLEKSLVKENVQELVRKGLEFKLGKINALNFYKYLSEKVDVTKFHKLFRYIRLLKAYKKIDTDMLIKEISDIQHTVYKDLAENETQIKLVGLYENICILDKLIHLKMSPSDWDYYNTCKTEFGIKLLQDIENLCGYKMQIEDSYLNAENAVKFYQVAVKRNDIMLQNFLNNIPAENSGVLIAGGFHSEGISSLLESKGVSYALVRPNITKIDEDNPYFSIVGNVGDNNLALPPFVDARNEVTKAVGAGEIAETLGRRVKKLLEDTYSVTARNSTKGLNKTEKKKLRVWFEKRKADLTPVIQSVFLQLLGDDQVSAETVVGVSNSREDMLKRFISILEEIKSRIRKKDIPEDLRHDILGMVYPDGHIFLPDVHEVMLYVLKNHPEFSDFVDIRPVKARLLSVPFVGHDMAVKRKVNPDNRPLIGLYGASGADISNFLLSTNAEVGYFVDSAYSRNIEDELISSVEDVVFKYVLDKYANGYGSVNFIEYIAFDAIIAELESIGVSESDIERIKLQKKEFQDKKGNITIEFDWAYPGCESKRRTIHLVATNISNPAAYPEDLKSILDNGIDFYYQRASLSLPRHYGTYIDRIASGINHDGFLIMDNFVNSAEEKAKDPIPYMRDAKFEKQECNDEMRFWADNVSSAFGYGWNVSVYKKEQYTLEEYEQIMEKLQIEMSENGYTDDLIIRYQKITLEWERLLKKSGKQDNRKNFKVMVNAYNDPARLDKVLESIYDELRMFEYGKGVEVCIVEHSDNVAAIDSNKRYVEEWNHKLRALGRPEWKFRYISLEEQFALVKKIKSFTGVNIDKEFLYSTGEVQNPEDLAGRGFASGINFSLLFAQSETKSSNNDTLVMFFDQDIEIAGLLSGEGVMRKRKIAHTFHYVSKAFDDPNINKAACALNGDPANSFDGLIEAISTFRVFFETAKDAESIDAYLESMKKMMDEVENIKKGKYSAYKVLYDKTRKGPAWGYEKGEGAPFGTGFIIREDAIRLAPLFNVSRGADTYYEIFLNYFYGDDIYSLNLPVIHNKSIEGGRSITEELMRIVNSSVGSNLTRLWVRRKSLHGGRNKTDSLFSNEDLIRIEEGIDVNTLHAIVREYKRNIRRIILEVERILILLDDHSIERYGYDLAGIKKFFVGFLQSAREIIEINEGEMATDKVFDIREEMTEWPPKIKLWQDIMDKIKGSSAFLNDTVAKTADDYISQGKESKDVFMAQIEEVRKNDVSEKYKKRLRSILKRDYKLSSSIRRQIENVIENYRIYGFKSVVLGADDFFMGWNNSTHSELFIAEDLIAQLEARGPPSLVDEYLLHEVLCSVLGHYNAIFIQKRIFSDLNYPNREEILDKSLDNKNKGLLGDELRSYIDSKVEILEIQSKLLGIKEFDVFKLIEVAKESGWKLIQRTDCSAIYLSRSEKFIIKVFFDGFDGKAKWLKEKLFYEWFNTAFCPRLFLSVENPRVVITENVYTVYDDVMPLYDYLHSHAMNPNNLKKVVGNVAQELAKMHEIQYSVAGTFDENGNLVPVETDSFDREMHWFLPKINYLKSRGYNVTITEQDIQKWHPRVSSDQNVLNHGDFATRNIFVDNITGEVKAVIDPESLIVTPRGHDVAMAVIGLIDSVKNDPLLLENLGSLIKYFLDKYVESSRIDRDAFYSIFSYYLCCQLIRIAERTDVRWKNQWWVDWKIYIANEIIKWDTFDIDRFILLIGGGSSDKISSNRDISIVQNLPTNKESMIVLGGSQEVSISVKVPSDLLHPLLGINMCCQLWTNVNGYQRWHAEPLEFAWCRPNVMEDNGKMFHVFYVVGKINGSQVSKDGEPFEFTTRVSFDGGKTWMWSNKSGDNNKIIVKGNPVSRKELWGRALSKEYQGLVVDFDGVLANEGEDISNEVIKTIAGKLVEGVPVAISTGRIMPHIEFVIERLRNYLVNELKKSPQDAEVILEKFMIFSECNLASINAGSKAVSYKNYSKRVMRRILAEIKKPEFVNYIKNGNISFKGGLIYFDVKAEVDMAFFAKILNACLKKMEIELGEPWVARYSIYKPGTFIVMPSNFTKGSACISFASKFGLDPNDVVRIGDQGQEYGLDDDMVSQLGGFSVQWTSSKEYPLSTLEQDSRYGNVSGFLWLMRQLKFKPLNGMQDYTLGQRSIDMSFYDQLPNEYKQLISKDELEYILRREALPEDWPVLNDLIFEGDLLSNVDYIVGVGNCIEKCIPEVRDDSKQLIIQAISINYFVEQKNSFIRKVKDDLKDLGYEVKADEIVQKLIEVRIKLRSDALTAVDYYFLLELEKLLGYADGTLAERMNIHQLKKTGNHEWQNLTDMIKLNLLQWQVVGLLKDKKPAGVIVQDIKDLGPGVKNWLEAMRRYNIDISGIRMAYILDGISEEDKRKLLVSKPVNVILGNSIDDVIGEAKDDNIVYLAGIDEIGKNKSRGIKLVEKGNAGPVLELSLCALMLDAVDVAVTYKTFIDKLVQLGFVSKDEADRALQEVNALGYIKLPKIERIFNMWNELKQEDSYLAVWA
jgi:hydroxymethylpyrimidine pyrophosphatase-like HAD family hydrolase